MNPVAFIANSPAEALAQIHARLGPHAVVISVKPIRAAGMAGLLIGQRRVEVIATLPEPTEPEHPPTPPDCVASFTTFDTDQWPSIAWLSAMGLLPEYAAAIQQQVTASHATRPPSDAEEWTAVHAALTAFWKPPMPLTETGAARPHVFIGPPGAGKTTLLCQWLTLAVLTQERRARVWRLDGAGANGAEFLDSHCELLGTPRHRFWHEAAPGNDLLLVDLPGVAMDDAEGMAALQQQLAALPAPRVHLVLNAANEWPVLLAQWQAFAPLAPEDLSFTHLDEERRRVKLWNFVLGTNCSPRFVNAGQKIPGTFASAAPEHFFPVQNR